MEYKIIKEFVKDVVFSNDKMPDILFTMVGINTKASIALDVEVKSLEDTPIKMVILNLTAGVVIDEQNNLFTVNTKYCTLVEVLKDLGTENLRNLLTQEVPEKVYPNLCEMVKKVTSYSGFLPLELPNYSFKERTVIGISDDHLEKSNLSDKVLSIKDGIDCTEKSFITLKDLFHSIEREPAEADFFKTLSYNIQSVTVDFDDFILNRFIFKHIQYNDFRLNSSIPDDQYSKRLLFGLLISNEQLEWRFIKNHKDLPEIKITYKGDIFLLSDMQIAELKEFAESVFADIMTDLFVSLYYLEYCHGGVILFPEVGDNKEKYYKNLPKDFSEEEKEVVDSVYARIQKTYLEDMLLSI